MSRPFNEILGMIKAHYDNDDRTFNSYAGAIIDYYTKDGDVKGVEEIRAIMTGQREQRTDTPLYLNELSVDKKVVDSSFDESISEIIEQAEEKELSSPVIDEISDVPTKKHRRTKAEMEALRNESSIDEGSDKSELIENEPIEKEKKRHRRTKQELEESGYYNK